MSQNIDSYILVFHYFISQQFYHTYGIFVLCCHLSRDTMTDGIFVYAVIYTRCYSIQILIRYQGFFSDFFITHCYPMYFTIYLIICKQKSNFWFWRVSNSFSYTYSQNVYQIESENQYLVHRFKNTRFRCRRQIRKISVDSNGNIHSTGLLFPTDLEETIFFWGGEERESLRPTFGSCFYF